MLPKPTVSFEFFPPKSEAGQAHFWEHALELAALRPSFVTVTYGAGGSTREWTIRTALAVAEKTGLPTAAHLTAIGTPRADLPAMAMELWEGGVRHIVALRGDAPKDPAVLAALQSRDCHLYANDLMMALRAVKPFELSVGCYPELHPEAASAQADLDALKIKIDAGADRAITQFFFDNHIYFEFVERARAAGITVPIVPGILPIGNFDKMLSFAKTCRATVPEWLHQKFAGLAGKPEDAHRMAEEVLAEQCRGLIRGGAGHIHFYTLNQAALTRHACQAAGLTA